MRDFEIWLSQFKESIANYSYYTNFEKVYANTDSIRDELCILNSLIGDKDIENSFERIITKCPSVLKCIPILLAKREKDIFVLTSEGEYIYNFKRMNYSIEQYKVFMRKTGLFDLLENHIIGNLVDYVYGVETGLDSNARKNRGGDIMEDLVEGFIINAGLRKGESYFKEMTDRQVEEKWGLDLSSVSNNRGTKKRFDFVIKRANCIYGIECNFYASQGSKLNETARSYKTIATEANNMPNSTSKRNF